MNALDARTFLKMEELKQSNKMVLTEGWTIRSVLEQLLK